jgi:hypothetical protein
MDSLVLSLVNLKHANRGNVEARKPSASLSQFDFCGWKHVGPGPSGSSPRVSKTAVDAECKAPVSDVQHAQRITRQPCILCAILGHARTNDNSQQYSSVIGIVSLPESELLVDWVKVTHEKVSVGLTGPLCVAGSFDVPWRATRFSFEVSLRGARPRNYRSMIHNRWLRGQIGEDVMALLFFVVFWSWNHQSCNDGLIRRIAQISWNFGIYFWVILTRSPSTPRSGNFGCGPTNLY